MTTQDLLCPMCEHGSLTPSTYSDTFQHRGADLVVEGLECYVCDECGADPVFEDQIRRNHVRVVDARRQADGLLTGREILALRKSLGLSQRDASEVFGGGANAFSKYERGEVAQSVAMDRLLRLVARYPLLLDDLRGHAGVANSAKVDDHSAYVDDGPLSLEGQHAYSTAIGSESSTVVDLGEWKQMRKAA